MFSCLSRTLPSSAIDKPEHANRSVAARTIRSTFRGILLGALGFSAVPALIHAQGTIDPNTVPLRELVREPGSAAARPKFVRVDPSGNIYVGTVSSTSTSSGVNFFITYSSVVRKYSAQGALLWSRSRNLTSVANGSNPTTYFESWGDGPDHQISDQKYAVNNVALAGMAIDSAGGVALVYDTYRVDTFFDSGSRTTISQTVSNNITLFVKLSATGNYVNEYYSFPDTGGLYDQASQVKSFETMPNGSFVALIWNYNFTNLGGHSQTIVQRIANNGSSADYTTLYGSADRDAFNRKKTSVDPIELGFSLIGEVYVATNDTPNPAVDFTGDSKHVIRRIDGTGNTTARIDILYANSATGQSGDTWSGMKVDANGNCYVGGATKPDLQQNVQNQVALKYGPTLAQEVWRTVVTGNTGNTSGVQIGSLGVTLAGTTNAFNSNLAGSAQWSVSRVSPTGGIVWHQFFAGQRYPGNSQTASGVVSFFVNSADNVFVYGTIPQPTLSAQVFGKFASDGTLQFIKSIPSIYIGASSGSSISNIAFSPTGTPVFATNYYNGVTTNPLYAQAVLELVSVPTTSGTTPPPPTSGPTARLVNLSVLTNVASAGNNFTMGYVVGGAGTTGSKPILIRAAGPTLGAAPFSIPGALADPKLELFAGTSKTGENDNWGGTSALSTAFASVGAFAYVNGSSLDAAVFSTIAPGDNSVRVSATGTGTGMVIAELYDATPFASLTSTSARLVNVSVLKNLDAGLTIGFVIDGSGSKKVLIRAVGPTIGAAPFNVAGAVADPQLTLFSGQTSIGSNDNWGGTAELTAAFTQVGAFSLPATSRDAALLATLQPGNYTVQVRGVGTTTGVAIVEVYEVP
jgi:hypothetical protein